uniref:LOC100145571 protein n=1 Tax=Xenopus tropicalis TaxID=8364 RepID=B1H381_XENTR|nr:LOC100145571 protein [Xenopus tropicalis]
MSSSHTQKNRGDSTPLPPINERLAFLRPSRELLEYYRKKIAEFDEEHEDLVKQLEQYKATFEEQNFSWRLLPRHNPRPSRLLWLTGPRGQRPDLRPQRAKDHRPKRLKRPPRPNMPPRPQTPPPLISPPVSPQALEFSSQAPDSPQAKRWAPGSPAHEGPSVQEDLANIKAELAQLRGEVDKLKRDMRELKGSKP